jgi:hypothetical protein
MLRKLPSDGKRAGDFQFFESISPKWQCDLPFPSTFQVFFYPSDHTQNFPPIASEIVSVDAFTLRKLGDDGKGAGDFQFF